MPDGQQNHSVPINPVQHQIPTLSKRDKPFPIFGVHIICGMTDTRLGCQYADTGADALNCAFGSVGVFIDEKLVQPLNICQCLRRPSQE
jgi:hypothetical protein